MDSMNPWIVWIGRAWGFVLWFELSLRPPEGTKVSLKDDDSKRSVGEQCSLTLLFFWFVFPFIFCIYDELISFSTWHISEKLDTFGLSVVFLQWSELSEIPGMNQLVQVDAVLIYLLWFRCYESKFPNFSVKSAARRAESRPTAASDNIAGPSFTTFFMNMYACIHKGLRSSLLLLSSSLRPSSQLFKYYPSI